MIKKAALALGGNLGDVTGAFKTAAQKLEAAGMMNIKLSRFRRTTPVDCAPGTPDFLNAALTGGWAGSVEELFAACQSIERESGLSLDGTRIIVTRVGDGGGQLSCRA